MKTLIKIPLIIIFLLTTSCSKDVDIDSSDTTGQLEGNWKVEIYEYEGKTTSILQNDVWGTQFYGFGWNMDLTMVFTKIPNNFSLSGTYFVDHFLTNRNGVERLYFGDLETDQAGVWEREGNQIEALIDDIDKRIFISELTNTKLIITINTNVSETESDGTITTTQNKEVYTLERMNK